MKQQLDKVRSENSLSNQSQSGISQFMAEKNRFEEENEMIEQMNKNPMTESQVTEMLNRGRTTEEAAEAFLRLRGVFEQLRADGLIVPDPPVSFAQFVKDYPDHNIIKASWLQHLGTDEYEQFRSAGAFKVFQDLPDGEKVQHYQYLEGNSWVETGKGMMIGLTTLTYPGFKSEYDSDQKRLIREAKVQYKKARNDINTLFSKLGLISKDQSQIGVSSIKVKNTWSDSLNDSL
jgi:hypothetical protein